MQRFQASMACFSPLLPPSPATRLVWLVGCALLLCATNVYAGQVNLVWNAVSAPNLGGYRLHYGQASRTYAAHIDVGLQTTTTVSGLTAGQTYYFAVTAYDNTGKESPFSDEVSSTMSTPATAPVAAFSASPTSGPAPVTAAFSDASTGTITAWAWDFGDGTSSTVQHPAHTYTTPGSYTVQLTVTGPGGSHTATKTGYISVAAPVVPAPVANFSASPTSGPTPVAAAFSDASTGTITAWAWDFGDGTSSTVQHPAHTYTTPGSYTVQLTVTGPGGSHTATKTGYISVAAPVVPAPVANFSANPTSGRLPLKVAFSDASTGTMTAWAWDFGDGTSSTLQSPTHTYSTPGTYSVQLTVTGPGGSNTAAKMDYITVAPALLEVGDLTIDYVWKRIAFRQTFVDPIVVAGPLGADDFTPATIRIRNVGPTGFEIRIQEWDYLDGTHGPETVSYMAMERGRHVLGTGIQVEAGRREKRQTLTRPFTAVKFSQAFDVAPVVLTTVTSANGASAVTTRVRQVTPYGFEVAMQEQIKNAPTHVRESIDYIAWQPSSGTVDGLTFEVKTTPNAVTDDIYTLKLLEHFLAIPMFLAATQTANDWEPVILRLDDKDPVEVHIQLEEEASAISHDLHHPAEVVGYMAFTYQ